MKQNAMSNVKDLICKAIERKQRVRFIYDSKRRVAEPQCCGRKKTDKDGLRAHLISGGGRPEQMFDLDKIESLELLDEYFSEPGPNYRKNDSAMKEIYCQL